MRYCNPIVQKNKRNRTKNLIKKLIGNVDDATYIINNLKTIFADIDLSKKYGYTFDTEMFIDIINNFYLGLFTERTNSGE